MKQKKPVKSKVKKTSTKKETTAKKETTEEIKPKKKKNYLNNKDMLKALRRCHEEDRITDEFAGMIMLLAERYGGRYEYAEYKGHIEDMKSAAVANVVRAWRGFNLEVFNNPFAYFTQAIKHTYWQYVWQEKKHRLNRDHILIALGELPSDTFMEDYRQEEMLIKITKENPKWGLEEIMANIKENSYDIDLKIVEKFIQTMEDKKKKRQGK
jgi:hypothetical protein